MNNKLRMNSVMVACLLCLSLNGCTPVVSSQDTLEPLIIRKADGEEVHYKVELANTDRSRQLGLMYREFMPEDQGMVLDFIRPMNASIWMKNTYIPLDLIFIDRDGVIVFLHKDAIPHDTTSISSGREVRAVLEVNANQIEKKGIETGDKVIYPIFNTGG